MSFNIENYLINEGTTIKSALLKVGVNKAGLVFLQTDNNKVIGVATDGDIRRALLRGVSIDDDINNCVNKDFFSAETDTPREQLIKQLDNNIRVIPILDKLGKLTSIVSKDYLPLDNERSIPLTPEAILSGKLSA